MTIVNFNAITRISAAEGVHEEEEKGLDLLPSVVSHVSTTNLVLKVAAV